MPRIARICAVNHPHHVTQRGNNKTDVFFDDEDRQFYLGTLKQYSRKWSLDIWAYCLMTNHVHILAVPRSDDSLSKGVGRTNLVYTQYINRKYGRGGRLWQNRFFSTIVDRENYLWAVARYIENNPVRAGLVQTADDYRWSSCPAHVSEIADGLLAGSRWLSADERKSYREFLMDGSGGEENIIRKATSAGRPLGGLEFVEKIGRVVGRDLVPMKPGRPRKESG
ncbi:MAG: transposase [Proteobacteria bacterium]|nr:transposase [Pseudomonadota bacterium]